MRSLADIVVFRLPGSGVEVVQRSREDLRATQVMAELMDTLRLYSWDQMTDPTFTPKHFDVEYDPIQRLEGVIGCCALGRRGRTASERGAKHQRHEDVTSGLKALHEGNGKGGRVVLRSAGTA